MNLENLNIFNMLKEKSQLCALALSSTLLAISLYGCDIKANNNNSNKINTMLLKCRNATYSLEISDYSRISSGLVSITLADGSPLVTNEMNVVLFNQNSKMMEDIIIQDSIVNVDTVQVRNIGEDVNTVLLFVDNDMYILEISDYSRISSGLVSITLADGSPLVTNETNVVLFNQNSKMMEQIIQEKEQVLTLIP